MLKLFCIVHESALQNLLEQLQRLGCVQFFDVKKCFDFLKPLDTDMERIIALEERLENLLKDLSPGRVERAVNRLLGPRAVPVELVEALSAGAVEQALDRIEEEYREYWHRLSELESRLESVETPGERETILSALEHLRRELLLWKRRRRVHLLALKDMLENLRLRAEACRMFGRTRSSIVIAGWVPQKQASTVCHALQEASRGLALTQLEPPSESDSPPILLDNPRIIRPYEVLTTSYGVPEYNGIDPTPLLAVSFTALFGMMFADVGYGLVLSALSLSLYLLTTRRERTVKDINLILFYAGTASMFFGLLAGEFFGGILKIEGLRPEFMDNLYHLLKISLLLGVVHISVSLVSRIASGRDVGYSLSLLLVLWGGVACFVQPQQIFGLMLTATGLLGLVLATGAVALEELIALAANVMSYARVAALASVHVTLSRLLTGAVESVPQGVAGALVSLLLFCAGAAFILVSGTFLVFVQSLRLHWLEFFRRFYSGMGEMFKPFTYKAEYIYVV